MPDNNVYIITVSSSQELTGYLGTFDNTFVAAPIPNLDTTIPTTTLGAAMAVVSSSSQNEVHVVASQIQQQPTGPPIYVLTYFWSSYEAGSGFGQWQPIQITETAGYSHASIAVGPNGEVIVAALVPIKNAPDELRYYVANAPGLAFNPTPSAAVNTSYPALAVDTNGKAHCIAMWRTIVNISPLPITEQPSLLDYTLAPGATEATPGPGLDIPIQVSGSISTDPLDWDDCTWTASTVTLGESIQPAWQPKAAGMTVRASGEIDVAFWNYPLSALVFFSLSLNSSTWNFSYIVTLV
jgi:hypothetical protein